MSATEPTRRALVVIPLPCEARTLLGIVRVARRRWERDHGQRMTTGYIGQVDDTLFGRVAVLWDRAEDDTTSEVT